ncbi:hypothetical protein E2C01_091881 [Portunus trituberculatus]|uniref:Uncharacterized protein n=1 Tax=Portunus trituberculatus TaxID=210409 RepID=A0A5B7JK73_PORTR|nr:hypothetical protein [Portunus trituberculatus]
MKRAASCTTQRFGQTNWKSSSEDNCIVSARSKQVSTRAYRSVNFRCRFTGWPRRPANRHIGVLSVQNGQDCVLVVTRNEKGHTSQPPDSTAANPTLRRHYKTPHPRGSLAVSPFTSVLWSCVRLVLKELGAFLFPYRRKVASVPFPVISWTRLPGAV